MVLIEISEARGKPTMCPPFLQDGEWSSQMFFVEYILALALTVFILEVPQSKPGLGRSSSQRSVSGLSCSI